MTPRQLSLASFGGDVAGGRAQRRLGYLQGAGAAAEGVLGALGGREEDLARCRLVEPA